MLGGGSFSTEEETHDTLVMWVVQQRCGWSWTIAVTHASSSTR